MVSDVAILGFVLDVSLRAIVVAAAVMAVLRGLHVRTAAVRHAAWATAMFAMLLLPALTLIVPPLSIPVPASAHVRTVATELLDAGGPERRSKAALATAATTAGAPRSTLPPSVALTAPNPESALAENATGWMTSFAISVYLLGLLFFAARLTYGWYLAVALIARAKRGGSLAIATVAPVFESRDISVPMTVGVIRPVIVLPVAWKTWDEETLAAVMAHETAHVRRRDPAISVAARLNRALFWFHPLAWWLERTVAATAEHACDETAAMAASAPSRYAEILLAMADAARRGGSRFTWQAVGVDGGGLLGARIDRLLGNDAFAPTSRAKKIATTFACACGIALAIACRQEVAATPLREDPGLSKRLASQAASTKRFNAARDLTQLQADSLEKRLETNPEDFDARWQLVTYYRMSRTVAWDKKLPGLRRHALWLVEHHPEHEVQAPALDPRYDPEGFSAARRLWQRHLASPAATATLVARAAEFFRASDKEYAERLIRRGMQMDPDSEALAAQVGPGVSVYKWGARLADLYTSALTGLVGSAAAAQPAAQYEIRVRKLLETTTDAALLAYVGSRILGLTPWSRDRVAYEEVRGLGTTYLERALELDPDNRTAKAALVRWRLGAQASPEDRLAHRAHEQFMIAEDITEFAKKDPATAKRQRDAARRDAASVLGLAEGHETDPAYSAAVMTSHQVLAAIALRDGDRELAIRHLQASVKVPASDQTRYLLPMSWMRPVNRLLKAGERERVASFLETLADLTVSSRERLLDDARAIREGRMTSSYQTVMTVPGK